MLKFEDLKELSSQRVPMKIKILDHTPDPYYFVPIKAVKDKIGRPFKDAKKVTYVNALPVLKEAWPPIKPSRHRSKRQLKKLMKRQTPAVHGPMTVLSLPDVVRHYMEEMERTKNEITGLREMPNFIGTLTGRFSSKDPSYSMEAKVGNDDGKEMGQRDSEVRYYHDAEGQDHLVPLGGVRSTARTLPVSPRSPKASD